MKRTIGLTAALVVALAMVGYAQKKADFSGTWTVDQAATDAANPAATTTAPPAGGGGGGGGRGMAGPLTITQTADALTIETQGRQGPQSRVYKLDGTESEITMGQNTAKAKAKWTGDSLVIETTGAGRDGTPVTTTATYSIDKDGVLWVETKNANGTQKRAYKKTT
jgi:hypothetical protein